MSRNVILVLTFLAGAAIVGTCLYSMNDRASNLGLVPAHPTRLRSRSSRLRSVLLTLGTDAKTTKHVARFSSSESLKVEADDTSFGTMAHNSGQNSNDGAAVDSNGGPVARARRIVRNRSGGYSGEIYVLSSSNGDAFDDGPPDDGLVDAALVKGEK